MQTTRRELYTPADALMAQAAEIQRLVDRLEAVRDAIHDSTDPDSATWVHVSAHAHIADMARGMNTALKETEKG